MILPLLLLTRYAMPMMLDAAACHAAASLAATLLLMLRFADAVAVDAAGAILFYATPCLYVYIFT